MIKRKKLHTAKNEVSSTDSLRAAQAIFKKHSASPVKIEVTEHNSKNKTNVVTESAKLAAKLAATSHASSMDDGYSTMIEPATIASHKSNSNSSLQLSLVSSRESSPSQRIITPPTMDNQEMALHLNSVSSSPGSLQQLSNLSILDPDISRHSTSYLDISHSQIYPYRHTSRLKQMKDRIHIHKNKPKHEPLVLMQKMNKLRATLRSDDEGSDDHTNDMTTFKKNDNNDSTLILSHNNSDISQSELDSDSDIPLNSDKENGHNKHHRKIIKKKYKASTHKIKQKIMIGSKNKKMKQEKKNFNVDKPWKSHRDVNFISQQERKRYEAIWMSNRFRYLNTLQWWPSMDNAILLPKDGLILGLIVKDIWQRSNLSDTLLGNIFDLVDTRCDGSLDRKSFIVGMWLVDQCLYGRKLPTVIHDDIWESVDKYVVNISMNNKINVKTKKKSFKKEVKLIKKTK